MAPDVVDVEGRPVRGEVGELVIRAPWIGMTRGFWQDEQRYLETYWSRFKNVWVHGDWAAVDEDGLWYILGRSDDTIQSRRQADWSPKSLETCMLNVRSRV